MRTNAINIALLGSVSVLFAACHSVPRGRVPVSEIGKNVIIVGDLGRPIGEEVTIHGYKFSDSFYRDRFMVDSLDGKPLPPAPISTSLHVSGIAEWPDNTKATLRGQEVGIVGFTHWGDGNPPPDEEGKFKPQQIIYLHFEVLDIVEPKGLKLGTER